MATRFQFDNKEYKFEIKWRTAAEVLPDKFNIEILKIFVNEKAGSEAMTSLLLDDILASKLLWFFIEEETSLTYEEYTDRLTIQALDVFREAFWVEVASFFGSTRKKLILDMWDMFKREIKNADLTSKTLDSSHLNSQQEQG